MFREQPQVQHVRIADGRGKRLGRSFRVKLWPTLIFLHDGKVITQLVRPTAAEVRRGFEQLMGVSSLRIEADGASSRDAEVDPS